jgi:hypothetical protein
MDELREWIREQMAAEETATRDATYNSRLGLRYPAAPAALEQIEADRVRIETTTEAELQDFGVLYGDRAGDLEEWRPV